ncbi:MAG: hypothetical protein IK064_07180, partial [Clostridia bacterium]|nr:hypothetical protein [Clostridia bacterium]
MDRQETAAEANERIYRNALILYDGRLFTEAAAEFARIPDYKDAAEKKLECEQRALTSHLDDIYADADKAAANFNVRSQEKAIQIFQTIPGYRDADERIEQAKRMIEEITQKERTDREEAIRAAREAERKRKARNKRIIRSVITAVCIAAVCAVGAVLFMKFAVPAIRYDRSVKQIEAGQIDEAYRTLHCLNYRDSSDLVFDIAKDRLKDAEVGSVVLFGAYPQGRITSDKKDPIEWIVLERDGSRMLLISKYALDALPYMRYDYDPTNTEVSWQTSLLRDWLNGEFMSIAFDEGESRMLRRTVINDMLPDGSYGMKTADRVFLLSIGEAKTYFPDEEARKCTPTLYALGFGAYRSSVDGTCLWWLRNPADEAKIAEFLEDEASNVSSFVIPRAACVGTAGEFVEVGHEILNRGYAVRPTVWVDIEPTSELQFP